MNMKSLGGYMLYIAVKRHGMSVTLVQEIHYLPDGHRSRRLSRTIVDALTTFPPAGVELNFLIVLII